MRSSPWVLQLITFATIRTTKSQLEIQTIHIIKSHLTLLWNDRREKKNGSTDHLLTAELQIFDNFKKNPKTSQFKYRSHNRTTYRIYNILRQKRAKAAWNWSESLKVQDSCLLQLHLMSVFFRSNTDFCSTIANTSQNMPRTLQAQSHFTFLMKCTSN